MSPLQLGALLAFAAVPVRVGLDRVEAEGGGALRGKRVGLIVHAASVAGDGRHAVDVLRAQRVAVCRLFAPEHGLRSRSAAGASVADGVDAETRLPVVSLYGSKNQPYPSDVQDLDALVFDLQDAGVRFYTYVSTLILGLEAAAEADIELVVLDRPNPLGGEHLAGPEAAPSSRQELVSMAPGPLVHGLTMGEMARLVNMRREKPARLIVVPMDGWRRRMTWFETGRQWVPPSPNLPSAESAMAYPGVCLIEATNVSEGRGTESPFLLLGAPWLRAAAVAAEVSAAGFRLEPTRFTPRALSFAPQPKYRDQTCEGVRVRVSSTRQARPYQLGVRLLASLRRLHPQFAWQRPGALDWLMGTSSLREALDRGDSVESILAADATAVEAFRRERQAALLYR